MSSVLRSPRPLLALSLTVSLAVAGCACGDDGGGDDEAVDPGAVVTAYADGVLASYRASLASATALDEAIDAFLTDPDDTSLDAAKAAWLAARDDYGPTEAFRFYDGPIDDPETGPEGLINAWPMDEAYVDYVAGDPDAGIVNDPDRYPTIDAELLASLNEAGGETNISTGWHAIEFLLWGQDLSDTGPGARPVEDYTTAPNADRRGAYLATVSDLLVGHLSDLVAAWTDAPGTYRAEFLALPTDEALTKIITGVGELSRGELAGERMSVAFFEREQENEHSCFSDNTAADIVANASGIAMVLTGTFPGAGEADAPSVLDLVRAEDAELADRLAAELDASIAATRAVPSPFDQVLLADASDDDPARQAVLAAITALEDQTDTIVAAATAIGITIDVS